MRSKDYSTWSVCLCVCVSICVSVTQHLTFNMIICATNGTNRIKVKTLSDLLWKCFVAKLERFLLVQLHDIKSAIFYFAGNVRAYESGPRG